MAKSTLKSSTDPCNGSLDHHQTPSATQGLTNKLSADSTPDQLFNQPPCRRHINHQLKLKAIRKITELAATESTPVDKD